MTEITKINHRLPAETGVALAELHKSLNAVEWKQLRVAYSAVLRQRGWTLQSIADLFDWSRERVRQIVNIADVLTAEALVKSYGLDVPQVPLKPVKEFATYTEPSPETLTRLLELQPLAKKVRSNSPKFREEAEEYSRLLNYSRTTEGVSLYRLAKRLGITHGAVRGRLVRYGYLTTTSTNKVYTAVLDKNRVR